MCSTVRDVIDEEQQDATETPQLGTTIARSWRSNWTNIIPFFSYPPTIRKVIYTTNAIESMQAQLRKVTRDRGAFPSPDSVRKVLYLAIETDIEKMEAADRRLGDSPLSLLGRVRGKDPGVGNEPVTQKSGQSRNHFTS